MRGLDSLPELSPGVLGVGAELLLNSQELVVLGEPLGPAGGSSLDLASSETNNEVSNEAVLSLPRPERGEKGCNLASLQSLL